MNHIGLTFRVTIDAEETLSTFMLMNATVEGIEETPEGYVRYYIPLEEWEGRLKSDLVELLGGHEELELLNANQLENRDWNAEWEASIEPVRVTEDLIITPSWKRDEAIASSARYVITIDPKMSFGTGHHETTRLCLQLVEPIELKAMSILDVGTGSGVLAIYALMRGASRAVGIDTDEWAVDNAVENRSLNNFPEAQLEIRRGELDDVVRKDESFDLIFANIHRNVLVDLAGSLAARLHVGHRAILSGLLIYDEAEVMEVFSKAGFALEKKLTEKEWLALRLVRLG